MRKIISRSVILYEKVDFLCDKKSKNIIYSNWNVINLCVQDASALNRASFYSDFLRADTCAWYDTPSLPSIETQPHASLLHWEEPPIMPSMEPRPGVQPQKLASILQKNKMIKNLKNNYPYEDPTTLKRGALTWFWCTTLFDLRWSYSYEICVCCCCDA